MKTDVVPIIDQDISTHKETADNVEELEEEGETEEEIKETEKKEKKEEKDEKDEKEEEKGWRSRKKLRAWTGRVGSMIGSWVNRLL